jgi:cytoskeletal protein CcmA (bactofilin family)
MWRKSEEAKPSSRPGDKPESVIGSRTVDSASASPTAAPLGPLATAEPRVEEAPASIDSSAVVTSPPSQISAGLKIRGEITGTSDLVIDGDIQGKIQLTGCKLTVGPSGTIKSDIEAREICVFGTVSGNLKATESVSLGNTGRVEGSVVARRISIDDGARLRGKVEMLLSESVPGLKAAAAASAGARGGPASSAVPAPSVKEAKD